MQDQNLSPNISSTAAPKYSKSLSSKPDGRIKAFLKEVWNNPRKRWTAIAIVIAIVFAVSAIPTSRYFVLNTVGVRANASVKVLDESTGQPLKNVDVTIHDTKALTNEEGVAELSKVKLGKTQMTVERIAFASSQQNVTIGLGSNNLNDVSIKPIGARYVFVTTDYVSGKPIVGAEASSGVATAVSNDSGEIVLTLDVDDQEEIEIDIKANGQRSEKLKISVNNKGVNEVKLVPDKPNVFISKKSGRYDVYRIDVDGRNEKVVLKATGEERDDSLVSVHSSRNKAAVISTREGLKNDDGFLLSSLTLLDIDADQTKEIAQSERFNIVGWHENKLIYVQVADGESAADPNRQKIYSYNFETGENKQIANANYFNDVLLAKDKIYYAPSSSGSAGINVSLFEVDTDGNNKRVLIEDETWNVFRKDFDTLQISVGQAWYEYTIGSDPATPTALNGAPAEPRSRTYVNNGANTQSLWLDQRDEKGVLINHLIETNEDQNVVVFSGLTNPIRWLNDSTVVFRVRTDSETADYAVNVNGGKPKKITNVADTDNIEQWYMY